MKLKRKLVSLILAAAVALPNVGVSTVAAVEMEIAADEVKSSSALWVEDKTTENTVEGLSTYSTDDTTSDTALTAMATGEFSYAVEGGNIYYNSEGEITDCDTSVTSAVIPSEIDGVKITKIGSYAFEYCINLTGVILSDSVTVIGDSTFHYCSSLTSITIPDSVTVIGQNAFSGCSSLTGISIPDSVTEIGQSAFSGCSSLTSISLPDSITEIGNDAFEACSSLISINIPDNVTVIGEWAFSGCSSLTDVIIPDSVTVIGAWAFSNCISLTNVSIPNSVTVIGEWAFSSCISLTSISIPDSVTEIGDSAFGFCSSLTNVSIAGNVTVIEDMIFYSCSSLTSVSIPDSVTEIGSCAFEYCSNLTSISIPDSVTEIGKSAFHYCISLTSISIPDSVTEIGDDAFGACSGLTNISISDSVTEIGAWAFNGCSSLTSVSIPDSVTTIRNMAFSGCSSLKSVSISDSVTVIGECAFSGCSSLTDVIIPDSVTVIEEYAFRGCNSLISVSIPDSVTEIGEYAFDGCSSLTGVIIPDSVTVIGEYAFSGCNNLTIVCEPSSYAEEYAISNEIPYYSLSDGTIGTDSSTLSFSQAVYEFNKNSEDIRVYDFCLNVTPKEQNMDDITFSSSAPEVAEVSSASKGVDCVDYTTMWGRLDIKSVGRTVITAQNSNGASASCLVIVTESEIVESIDKSYGVMGGSGNKQPVSKEEQLKTAIDEYETALSVYEQNLAQALKEKRVSEKNEDAVYESMKLTIAGMVTVPKAVQEACYWAIFNTIADMSYSELALEKIDMSKDEITVSTKLINQIADAFAHKNKTYSFGEYDVTVDVTGFNGANFGSLTYKKKNGFSMPVTVGFTTSKEEMARLSADFLNQMKSLEVNALNEALNATIYALFETVGVDKYIKSKFTKAIDKYAPELNNLGLGELVSFASDCKEVAEKIEKISKTSPNDYQSVYNEIKALSRLNPEGTSRISTTITNKAYKSLSDCRKNLIKAAINYINNTPYEPTLWDKMFSWKCPVNIVVYDSNGVEIGSIIEDEVTGGSEDVMLVKTGDLKRVYLKNGAEVSFKVTAYDYGVLNVSVEDYSDGVAIGRQNFYDIPLDLGDELTTSAKADVIETVVINTPSGERLCDEYIPAGQSAAVNVNVQIEGNGSVRNSGTYAKGDAVNLIAEADEGYRLAGWYNGDILESTSVIYDFSANEDTELTAVFKENPESLDFIYGDANADNLITAMDSASVLQKVLDASFVTGIESMGGDYMTYLDVNADGMLTASDASYILQKTLDNSFKMPCEE